MKREIFTFLAGALLAGSLFTGCSYDHPSHHQIVVSPTGEVYVPEAPPPSQTEALGAPPTPTDVWIPGYWTYHDARWVWVPGHWQVPPQIGKTWVAGHWDSERQGWVWTPGHWE